MIPHLATLIRLCSLPAPVPPRQAQAVTVRRVGAMDDLSCIDEQIDSIERANRVLSESPVGRGSPDLTLNRGQYTAGSPTTPDVRLWHRAVVVHQVGGGGGGLRSSSAVYLAGPQIGPGSE